MKITLAQLNFLVGDIESNARKIIDAAIAARDNDHTDLIVFPELCLTGYPPEDLLFRPGLYDRLTVALEKICQTITGVACIIGYPEKNHSTLHNVAAFINNGEIQHVYRKQRLPNYSVFDEKRYFAAGKQPSVVTINNTNVAITICEDLWYPGPLAAAKEQGAEICVCLNASPYHMTKMGLRLKTLNKRITENELPIVYVNLVGGQDELVFDGGSMVLNAQGEVCEQLPSFQETCHTIDTSALSKCNYTPPEKVQSMYDALVLGVRDYIEKNGFPGILIGLSGGIDSALTLAIAVDALGKERVHTVMMPSRYSTEGSVNHAHEQLRLLGVEGTELPIEPMFNAYLESLSDAFSGKDSDTTEENLQARIRGAILMALSNKFGSMVLSTGNKSELAVGYCTLYGDMVGGFCALKDVFKTQVYALANYRNTLSPAIPQSVIDKAPSAELAPDQTDQDSLPPYDLLDEILERYIEKDQSVEMICEAGFDQDIVVRVTKMVDRNEYKRRQGAPGSRITERAFGRDRRYPITSGFNR